MTLTAGFGYRQVPDKGEQALKRTQISIFFLFIVLAVAAMTFAGTASAGWTWDEGAALSSDGP
jgi:hypothetical protein